MCAANARPRDESAYNYVRPSREIVKYLYKPNLTTPFNRLKFLVRALVSSRILIKKYFIISFLIIRF